MGLPVSIHLRGPGLATEPVERVVASAFAELRRVDELFSTYRPDSQVSQLRRGERGLAGCDPMVQEVAKWCQEATDRTGGAFTAYLPDAEGRAAFEPTGLVKGWAVQRAAELLAELPGHAYCVNAGGDVLVGGGEPASAPWRVGIEDPRDRSRVAEVVELVQGGVATSGTAARGAHLWDPATRRWVHRAGSVTVMGPSLMWADVWATALFVGPPELAERFAVTEPDYRRIVL
jgi:FAD:protein FMN transferase